MGKVLGYLLIFPAAIINTILRGWALTVLWSWFITSQFPQVPHLGIVGALGVVLVVGLIRSPGLTDKEAKEVLDGDHESLSLAGRWIQTAVYTAITLICLFSGWIYHLFM